MLKLSPFNIDAQKKYTPEELQGFKDTADVDEAKKRARQTLQDYQTAIEQAQSMFSQSAQMQTPERQQVGKGEGLMLAIGDALRNVISTAPRKYRQEQAPGIQVAQGLKDQEYARQLQDAQIGYQNEQNKLLAGQRAAEVGLRKFELGYEGAERDVVRETDEARFNKTEGRLSAAQAFDEFIRTENLTLDKDRAQTLKDQWQKDFDRLNETEAAKLLREQAGYEAQGLPPDEARKMAFADKMISVRSAELKGLELKRTKELYDALPVSAEVKHTLWQREAEIEQHKEQMLNLRKQREVMGRGGSASNPFVGDFLKDIGSEMSVADDNIAYFTKLLEDRRAVIAGGGASNKTTEATSDYWLERLNYWRKEKDDLRTLRSELRVRG